jgi:hypothetical protein
MNNKNQSGIGISVRQSVSVLLIFAALAITNAALAADFKNTPSPDGIDAALTNSHVSKSTSEGSQLESKPINPDGNTTLFAMQGALFCYTPFGTFRMLNWVPVGASCYAQFSYYPFAAWGVAGN